MASAAPLIAARQAGFPLIAHPADKWLLYSLQDIGQLIPANNRKQRAGVNFIKRVVQPPLRRWARPDYILAVSQFIRRLHLQAGYAPAQSCATYLGVHTNRFTYQAHPYPGNRRWRLIFAGQLWAGKGPQVAIEAIRILRQQPDLPEVELNIYGGGTEGFVHHLQTLIHKHGLEDRVYLRGFAAQPDLIKAFHSHDLFLFCSLWDEPFSGGLLEALGSGLPTVATTAGGTPEAMRHEANGLLVRPDDPAALAAAIIRYMREPALYERVGAQAAAEVQAQWGFDAYLDRLERVYQAIAQGHRPDAPIAIDQLVNV
jgi:glycosyltransferase involved in cell wall biosynthesis